MNAWQRGRGMFDALWTWGMDFCFPRQCPLCGRPSDRSERLVCWDCFRSLPLRTHFEAQCRVCGRVPEGFVEKDFVCDRCRQWPPAFDGARAAAPFQGGVRELLHAFKYRRSTWLRADLCDLLGGACGLLPSREACDLIVPVPLHPRRQKQRSYNQSALLASALGRRLQIPVGLRYLVRTRKTPSQTRLNARARRVNVRNAFEVRREEWVRGRRILLVDDVMTTGATLDAAARALKRAGAWRVWAVTVAHG